MVMSPKKTPNGRKAKKDLEVDDPEINATDSESESNSDYSSSSEVRILFVKTVGAVYISCKIYNFLKMAGAIWGVYNF